MNPLSSFEVRISEGESKTTAEAYKEETDIQKITAKTFKAIAEILEIIVDHLQALTQADAITNKIHPAYRKSNPKYVNEFPSNSNRHRSSRISSASASPPCFRLVFFVPCLRA